MKVFTWGKDGGPESTVSGFWFIEIKSLFSIVLLKFEGESRAAFHNHAFNSYSIILKGKLYEKMLNENVFSHRPFKLITTLRSTFHKVDSFDTTWVLSFRGPWAKRWNEWNPVTEEYITLENGRKEV